MIENMARRDFLRNTQKAACVAATLLVGGCGSHHAKPLALRLPSTEPQLSADEQLVNAVLMLGYVSTQYHLIAATGTVLPEPDVSGLGRAGSVDGGRRVELTSDAAREMAGRFVLDKPRHLAALRAGLGNAAARQPAIAFGGGLGAPFSLVGQRAQIVASDANFDAFADEDSYLVGAVYVERELSAAYRSLTISLTRADLTEIAYGVLPDAIYHDGLLRTVIAAKSENANSLQTQTSAFDDYLSQLDDQGQAGSQPNYPDIRSSTGGSMPMYRSGRQVLNTLLQKNGTATVGGFLPAGANGVMAA